MRAFSLLASVVMSLLLTGTFRIDNYSLLNGDSEKGIAYSESPPMPLVSKLDHFEPPPHLQDDHGGFIAYKALKANWYLYFAR